MGLEGYIYTKLAYKMENKISIKPGQSCKCLQSALSVVHQEEANPI